MNKVLITGSAGFIGFFTSQKLLQQGWNVIGIDCMSDYYDVEIKKKREEILLKFDNYKSIHAGIHEPGIIKKIYEEERPSLVIHLGAQAGVRYSLENPRAYLESNIVGTFEILEASRMFPPKHILMASTSSAYGANLNMPYLETIRTDYQMSFYVASKKSTENLCHSYSHIYNLPITMFRFFTVYGLGKT